MSIYTPELLWHGGGNENGKPDPVYSVDMHPLDVLATAGIDANIPPKGSVRVSRFLHARVAKISSAVEDFNLNCFRALLYLLHESLSKPQSIEL